MGSYLKSELYRFFKTREIYLIVVLKLLVLILGYIISGYTGNKMDPIENMANGLSSSSFYLMSFFILYIYKIREKDTIKNVITYVKGYRNIYFIKYLAFMITSFFIMAMVQVLDYIIIYLLSGGMNLGYYFIGVINEIPLFLFSITLLYVLMKSWDFNIGAFIIMVFTFMNMPLKKSLSKALEILPGMVDERIMQGIVNNTMTVLPEAFLIYIPLALIILFTGYNHYMKEKNNL